MNDANSSQASAGLVEPQAQAGTWKDEINRLEKDAPDWFEDFNETDPFVASHSEVQRLIETAPDQWARGLVMGIDMFRCQMEAITGRPYRYAAESGAQGNALVAA